jgi:hypothetical protein
MLFATAAKHLLQDTQDAVSVFPFYNKNLLKFSVISKMPAIPLPASDKLQPRFVQRVQLR